MTRHQVRAARILLRLSQEALAGKAHMGVATLRRYEGGQEIGTLRMRALRQAIEAAGAVLIAEGDGGSAGKTGVGVALLPLDRLPDETRQRIVQIDAAEAANSKPAPGTRRPGRPRKVAEDPS